MKTFDLTKSIANPTRCHHYLALDCSVEITFRVALCLPTLCLLQRLLAVVLTTNWRCTASKSRRFHACPTASESSSARSLTFRITVTTNSCISAPSLVRFAIYFPYTLSLSLASSTSMGKSSVHAPMLLPLLSVSGPPKYPPSTSSTTCLSTPVTSSAPPSTNAALSVANSTLNIPTFILLFPLLSRLSLPPPCLGLKHVHANYDRCHQDETRQQQPLHLPPPLRSLAFRPPP